MERILGHIAFFGFCLWLLVSLTACSAISKVECFKKDGKVYCQQ